MFNRSLAICARPVSTRPSRRSIRTTLPTTGRHSLPILMALDSRSPTIDKNDGNVTTDGERPEPDGKTACGIREIRKQCALPAQGSDGCTTRPNQYEL